MVTANIAACPELGRDAQVMNDFRARGSACEICVISRTYVASSMTKQMASF